MKSSNEEKNRGAGSIKIKCSIIQGDLLPPLLFCTVFIPTVNNMNTGKIHHKNK
jgi:hypothetical protein